MINIRTGQQVKRIELGDYVAASPAVRNSRAYFGTFGNQVLCVNLDNSEIIWKYEHDKRKFPYYSSAAVTEDIIVVGGRDKMVHALDPKTGEEIWNFTTKSKVESSPIIVGEKVLVASARGVIYILDLNSGKAIWQFDTAASLISSASFDAGKFVIGNDDGIVFCFGKK